MKLEVNTDLDNLSPTSENKRKTKQALVVWGIFTLVFVLLNGTIPFILGADMHAWTSSTTRTVLLSLVIYAGIFMVVPLILIKGWKTVRQPGFLYPLLLGIVAITLSLVVRGVMVIGVIVIAYLHWRYDLSEFGIRSKGWKGDIAAIILLAILSFIPLLFRTTPLGFTPGKAILAMLDRMFANPASTIENLFYFGFLTERLSYKTGKWLTPVLIGLMYVGHEMSNPEYWYGGMNFVFIFFIIAISAAVYLWRRNVVVTWLSDGISRLVGNLF